MGSRSALGSRCTSLARSQSYTLQQRRNICLAQLGIFFSTSTGHTEDIASIIKEVTMQPSFTAERRMHVWAFRVGARCRRCRPCRHWRDGAGKASRLPRPRCGCTHMEHRLRHRTERNQLGRYSRRHQRYSHTENVKITQAMHGCGCLILLEGCTVSD